MTCKGCKNGKYIRKTDTVHCRLLDRTLIVNRADVVTEDNLEIAEDVICVEVIRK